MNNAEIRKLIDGLAPAQGVYETGIEGVTVFRISTPLTRTPGVYSPGVCVLTSGSKKVHLDNQVYVYDADRYFCCTVPMPVEAEISYASADEPLLGLFISLESPILTELASELEAAQTASKTNNELGLSLAIIERDVLFDDSVLKLLQLANHKEALQVLAKGRLREVYYAIMAGAAGSMVRQTFGVGDRIAKTIQYVRDNLHETITVEELAEKSAMSRAVFHRKFKAATSLSPLQFVKNLKLNYAAKAISTGITISEAALQSGYSSTSQFSREFKRQYGTAPRDWHEKSIRFDD